MFDLGPQRDLGPGPSKDAVFVELEMHALESSALVPNTGRESKPFTGGKIDVDDAVGSYAGGHEQITTAEELGVERPGLAFVGAGQTHGALHGKSSVACLLHGSS